jgi:hypothetical protein
MVSWLTIALTLAGLFVIATILAAVVATLIAGRIHAVPDSVGAMGSKIATP